MAAGFRLWRWARLPSLPGLLPSACATGRGSHVHALLHQLQVLLMPASTSPLRTLRPLRMSLASLKPFSKPLRIKCPRSRMPPVPDRRRAAWRIGGVKTGGEGEDAGGASGELSWAWRPSAQRPVPRKCAQHLVDAVDGGAEEQGLGVVAGLDRNPQGGFQNADLELLRRASTFNARCSSWG